MPDDTKHVSHKNGKIIDIKRKIKPKYSVNGSEIDSEIDDKEKEVEKKFDDGFEFLDDHFIFKRASDKKGHSAVLTIRVAPWIVGVMSTIIENKSTGYKNISEFVRDSLAHRAKFWSNILKDKTLKQTIHKRRMGEWLAMREDAVLDFKDSITRMRKLCLEMISEKRFFEFDEFIKDAIVKAKDIHEPYWENKYFQAIRGILVEMGMNPKTYLGEEEGK